MKIPKPLLLFTLTAILVACGAPTVQTSVTSTPTDRTRKMIPAATATSTPTFSTPNITKISPTPIDPSLSVIQVNYSASNSGQPNTNILLVEPETGQSLKVIEATTGKLNPLAATSNRLAASQGTGQVCEPMAYGTTCFTEADELQLVDLETMHTVTATLPTQSWVELAAFSPDGNQLALADNQKQNSTLMLFDAENGSLIASQPLTIRPSLITFRQSKNQLIVYGQPLDPNPGFHQPGAPHVLLLELPDLKIDWDKALSRILSGFWCETNCDGSVEQPSFANWLPAVVAAPDANELYIAHADQNYLTTVNLTSRSVDVSNLQSAKTWLERMLSLSTQVAYAKGNQKGTTMQGAISPNGQRLYLLAQSFHSTQGTDGNWKTDISYSGLQVIDVLSGRILKHLETHATQLQISPDGDFLYMMNWDVSPQPVTQIVNTKNLQIVKTLPGWEVTLTRRLNGTPVAMVSQAGYSTEIGKEAGMLNLYSFSVDHQWKTGSDTEFLRLK